MRSFNIMLMVFSGLVFFTPKINSQNNPQGFSNMNSQIVQNFVSAINEHNVGKICSLMADDPKFIDSHGNEVVGKEKMRVGWIGYFQLFPDYKIEIIEMFFNGDTVGAFGFAGGTFEDLSDKKGNYWRLPAAWKAIIKNGKIQLWQVYVDAKIPFDIINANKRQ